MTAPAPAYERFTWFDGKDVPTSDWSTMFRWFRANPGLRILHTQSQVVIYTRTDEVTAFDRSTWAASRLR